MAIFYSMTKHSNTRQMYYTQNNEKKIHKKCIKLIFLPIGREAAELGIEEAPPPGDGGAVSADRAWV